MKILLHHKLSHVLSKCVRQLADDGIISMILKRIPGAEGASEWAKKHGFGQPTKRPRGSSSAGGACVGGAVMGKGLNDWV